MYIIYMHTLREVILAGTNFREKIFKFFVLIFARTDFRENTTL